MRWNRVDVKYIPTPDEFPKYVDIIIPIGVYIFERVDTQPEAITVKWNKLYVYR